MTNAESGATVSASLDDLEAFFPAGADTGSPISSRGPLGKPSQDWERLVYRKLKEWARDPTVLVDEGIDAPSERILLLALRLAESLQAQGADCPDRLVPDPNGGIVFRYRGGGSAAVFHVWDDGTIERHAFDGNRLVDRSTINLAAPIPNQWQCPRAS